jgi:hypothetical protein
MTQLLTSAGWVLLGYCVIVIGVTYMAYSNGRWHKGTFLLRLRPCLMKEHRLMRLPAHASGLCLINRCSAGHELEFVMAPNLHWPDTMFSFDSSTGVLYTCDAFGLHYCDSEPFDTDLKAIEPHFRFYYDCLMKPNARSVLSALKRTKDMDYSTIAVGHGPLLRYNLSELVGRYSTASLTVCFVPRPCPDITLL